MEATFHQAKNAFAQGDLATAEQLCLQLVTANPGAAGPWSLLAETALKRSRPDAAVVCAGKAVALDPDDPVAQLMQAKCLTLVGRIRDAREAAEAGAALAPRAPAALDGLGAVFSMLGQHARALELFRAALALAPDNPQILYNLAAAERMLGLLEAAEDHCDQAIQRDPRFYLAYSLRSDLRQQTAERNHIDAMERLITDSPHPQAEILLRFALGKECDDVGKHARAFRHFERGAALYRRDSRYAVGDDIAVIGRIMHAQTAEALNRAPKGFDGDDPIFIVGLPRSGTTLVERLVAAHSQVRSAGELGAFPAELRRLAGTAYWTDFPASIDPAALGIAYSQAARQFDGLAAGRFIDKFPDNYLHCGAIHAALPRARIVALRRHPAATCFALYRTHFAGRYPFSYSLEDLADYYAAFDRLMRHWKTVLPQGAFLEVSYENLVTDIEGESRRILAFLGLPWEEGVLRFHESRTPSATASSAQIRRPIYATSVGKWRNYEAQLQPMLNRLAGL